MIKKEPERDTQNTSGISRKKKENSIYFPTIKFLFLVIILLAL